MPTEPTAPEPISSPWAAYSGWGVMQAWPQWLRFSLPLLLALLVGVAFQGTRGLTETSETRYAECAREMLVTGNWLEPQLEYQPHWTKPPAAYWCIAAGMKVFGANTWGARLPGVLALLVATWGVGAMGRRLWGEREGLAAGVAFALGFPAFGAYVVTTDIYLTAAETLAATAFVFAATEPDAGRRRWLAGAMWAAWGLGFLIKGPPALLPLLAIIPWNLLQPRERRVPLGHPLGLVCFAAVALPWYLIMLHRHPDLLQYYVGTEIVARVSTNLGHNRAWYKAIEIYAPAMLGACGAFGLWAMWLAFARGGWRGVARWRELVRARDVRLLLVGWVVLPLIVFCLSRSKLHLYLLPLVAPLALIAGRVLANRASWRALRNVTIGSLIAFVAIKGVLGQLPSRRDMAALGAAVRIERAELPAGAPIVLWDEAVNHGVTFYLGLGREQLPERIAEGEKGKFEHWTPEEFLARYDRFEYPQGAVLVVDRRKAGSERFASLRAALALTESPASTKHWSLLRLPPARKPTVPAPAAGR